MRRYLLSALLVCVIVNTLGNDKLPDKNIHKEIADKLYTYYKSIGMKVNTKIIEDTAFAIDLHRSHYFQKNQFSRQDFLALAMIESNFKLITGAAGEVGIFQIMPHNISKSIKHPFNIDTNTKLAMKVLKDKYTHHTDYKTSIIAYNGLVYHRGKLSEKYWKAFQQRKIILAKLNIE